MVSEYNRTALFSRNQPGGVFTINDLVNHPGNIWFVDSGDANASTHRTPPGLGAPPTRHTRRWTMQSQAARPAMAT